MQKFCVRLLSNANTSYFQNSLSEFQNDLGANIRLDNNFRWHCALNSLTINRSLDRYDSPENKLGDAILCIAETFKDHEKWNVVDFARHLVELSFSPHIYTENYFMSILGDDIFHFSYDNYKKLYGDEISFEKVPIDARAEARDRQMKVITIKFDTSTLLEPQETLEMLLPRYPKYIEAQKGSDIVEKYGLLEMRLYTNYCYTLESILKTCITDIAYSIRIYFNGNDFKSLSDWKSEFMSESSFTAFYSEYKSHANQIDLIIYRFINKFISSAVAERNKYCAANLTINALDETFFLFLYVDCINETSVGGQLLNVLAVIPITSLNNKGVTIYSPPHLVFHPVSVHELKNIKCILRTEKGKIARFKSSSHPTIVELVFEGSPKKK
jgi:hypothetical protein